LIFGQKPQKSWDLSGFKVRHLPEVRTTQTNAINLYYAFYHPPQCHPTL
jgi:hypothetical protein